MVPDTDSPRSPANFQSLHLNRGMLVGRGKPASRVMRSRGNDRDPRLAAIWRLAFLICLVAFPAEAEADYAAGVAAYGHGDYAAAFTEWAAAAAAGDAHAEQGLGVLYESGRGVPAPDFTQAVQWYRAAAAQGFPAGQNNLALLY